MNILKIISKTLKIMRNKFFLFSFLLLAFANIAFAQTTTTTQSGNWSDAAIWDNGVPTASTDAVINHDITLDVDGATNNITVNAGLVIGSDLTSRALTINGTSTITNTGSLTVAAFNVTHTINFKGNLTNNGTIDLYNSSVQSADAVLDGPLSISGTMPQFARVTFNSGNISTNTALDIDGAVIIETGVTFDAGNFTHTVAGNWTENAGGQMLSSGTIELNAATIQSVTSDATFNNLTFNGGGVGVLGAGITISGNLVIDNNTEVKTSQNQIVQGNLTINDGSMLNASAGTFTFNSGASQTLTIGTTDGESAVIFHNLTFDNGGTANPKTVDGNIVSKSSFYISNDAVANDVGTDKNHRLASLRLDGICNFNGTITATGGTFYKDGNSAFTINADIIVEAALSIQGGDAMITTGNITVPENSNGHSYLRIFNNASLTGTASKTLSIENSESLYILGENNFPTGFGTIALAEQSFVRFEGNIPNQNIPNTVQYGHLYLNRGTSKTADGDLIIRSNLYVYNGTNFLLGNFNHTLGGHIQNSDDNWGNGSITATGGSFTLNAPDADQYILNAGTGSYTFHDLNITNTAPTSVKHKRFYDDIRINGNLTVTNAGGNEINFLDLTIYENIITGTASGNFNIGANVKLLTSGINSFETSVSSFGSINLDVNSTIRFNRTQNGSEQHIPGGFAYGNIELAGSNLKLPQANLDINGNVSRAGNTPVLTDNAHEIRVAGNWNLAQSNTNLTGGITGNYVIFDGNNQTISQSNFNNVSFGGTGTKTITGALNISTNLLIKDNAVVEVEEQTINIQGNWTENDNGQFKQDRGSTIFDGSINNQTVKTNTQSYFAGLVIDKPTAGAKTLSLNSKVNIRGTLSFSEDNAVLDLNGNEMYVGLHFYFRKGCSFIHNGGKVFFNGSEASQLIRNYNDNPIVFNDVEFLGTATKRLYDNPFIFEGDVTISNSTLDGHYSEIHAKRDWINNGIFKHFTTLYFDGARNQNISHSGFHTVHFGGGNYIKTLSGDITLTGNLYIDDATLDVGSANNNITLDDNWYNNSTGSFIAQQGTVTFTGENNYLFTGESNSSLNPGGSHLTSQGGTKSFYNLTINCKHETNWLILRGDLHVANKLDINNGDFRQSHDPGNYGINDIYVGGDFINKGRIQNNNYGDAFIELNASAGDYTFEPGSTNQYSIINFTGDGSYTFNSTLRMYNNRALTISGGELKLNANNIETTGAQGDINLSNGATINVNGGANIIMGANSTFTNNGGNFILVGEDDTPASIIASTGNFNYLQTAGTIEALNYHIESTRGNGIEIQGGTIDATNNFSQGSFSSGAGNAYLTTSGIDLGTGMTITGVTFNAGPTYNVERTSGTGSMNFENAVGTLAGEDHDNDPATFVNWSYPGAVAWDGNSDGDGDNIHWNDPNNWSGDVVPDANSIVILDHSAISGAYTVEISTADALAQSLSINSGANPISLTLNGYELSVGEDITIGNNSVLTQTGASDVITLGGDWSNAGTFNAGSSTVVFNPTSGTHTISEGNSNSFHNLTINGAGGKNIISSALNISGNVELAGGVLEGSTATINVQGDWTVAGGSFEPGTSTVIFNNSGNQNINGGNFYELIIDGTGTKNVNGNIDVDGDITIKAGTVLNGGTHNIYVGADWINLAGNAGFTQTGTGMVIFDDASRQDIGDNASLETTFNHIRFAGSEKVIEKSIIVQGNMTLVSGNVFIRNNVDITATGGSNTFKMNGGRLYVEGHDADNSNNFPKGFANINLAGGEVVYYANFNQTVYPTTYYNLTLRRRNAGSNNTKNLLGDITVKNGLTVYDVEILLDVNNFTINLGGYLSFPTNGRQIEWGNDGTIIHFGESWTVDGDIDYFNNVIKKNAGYIRFIYKDFEIKGNMSILEDAFLNQGNINITCTGVNKTFTLAPTARAYSSNPATLGASTGRKAFPVNFANYNLHPKSRVYINGTIGDQTIYTVPNYGNLYLYTNAEINQSLDGNLDVEGELRMYNEPTLIDNGYNINVAGPNVDLRNYMPTSTITFDGADQRIMDAGIGQTIFDMNNVVFSGSGQKSLHYHADDYYVIHGNLTINSGATVYIPRRLDFSGQNWVNNGTFNHAGNIVNFIGTSAQSINPGADNKFYAVHFASTGQKNFVGNGINVGNGAFIIEANVNMANLTHKIASERIMHNSGVWTTNNANFVFDRNGTQYLPANFNCNDLYFRKYDQWDRVRYLEGIINVNNLNIEEGTRLYCSQNNLSTTPAYNVTVRGNFLNSGALYAWGNTFAFESTDTNPKIIKQGRGYFDNVTFNQAVYGQSSRVYTLTEETFFYEDMTIGSGATLDLNAQTLHLGNDDPNDPVVPPAEQHTIQTGGVLRVNAGAVLDFSCRDNGNTSLNVDGTLEVLGTDVKNAIITSSDWNSNTRRIDININAGGTIAAQYYLIKYLTNEGLFVHEDANVDATNNFSHGIWSNLNTGGGTYLHCNATVSNPVNNVAFNFDGTPVQGTHFNVKRESGKGTMTFDGSISGLLGGETYEADPIGMVNPGLIVWPAVTEYYWTGAESSDWFNPNNWSSGAVPTSSTNAIIPLRNNNPIITGDAVCKDLKIIDSGFLSLQTNGNLDVSGNVYIGLGDDVAILAVDDPADVITVAGSWSRGTNAMFLHGGGTVEFNALGGNVSIDPDDSAFGNVTFNGGASFVLTNIETLVDGNFSLINGAVSPINNNYRIKIRGDYVNAGGTFDIATEGTVYFDGSNLQRIENGHFNDVIIDGTNIKSTVSTLIIEGDLLVKNTSLQAGAPIIMKGNVEIESTGTFNDGGHTHTFSGVYWIGSGNYAGTGTVEFTREGTQRIKASKFNNLTLKNNGYVNLEGDVEMTGNFAMMPPCTYLNMFGYNMTNTSGTGTFFLDNLARIYIRGANNFPVNFSNYDLHPGSYTIYDGSMEQTIAGVPVTYGRLYLDNGLKIAANHLDINGILYLYNDATLDVTTNNYRINIAGDWYNLEGATFIPHEGEVIFDGDKEHVYMRIYEASVNTNQFYNLSVNKSFGDVRSYWGDITVLNNLRVINGSLLQDEIMYVGGNMTAISGTFGNAGTYYLRKPAGTSNLQFNGSIIRNLTINSGAEYILQDDLKMTGNFNLLSGTFDGNGNIVTMGDNGETHEIFGIYKIGPGGTLKLPTYGVFNVNGGAEMHVVGDADNIATVTHNTGRYYFNVENGAFISAANYLFEYMEQGGIYVKDGATIHNEYNFSYGTFTNPAADGTCLRIENNQNFTQAGGNPIREVSFPYNPGAGARNVTKTVASGGMLDFTNYSGEFAGEDFDNDPNNLINWIAPPYVMWTGNVSSDWYNPANWEIVPGPNRVPLITDNVLITQRQNQPVINVDGAVAKTLEIEEGASLTLSSSAATDTTLKVNGDVNIMGDLNFDSNGNNTMSVAGNWTNNGVLNAGDGTLIFNSPLGIKSIDNGNDYFYNMHVNTASELKMSSNLTVLNDFIIQNGIFNLSNRDLTVKGDFYNYADFLPQTGKLVLASNDATQIFNPGNSDYYIIDVSGTATINLDNDLDLTHNMNVNSGIFNLNGHVFNMGDGDGIDVLTLAGGTLNVNANAYLKPGNSASVELNNGGRMVLVGNDVDNPAYLQAQTGTFAFNVNNGGIIEAKYYNIQHTNIFGIRVHKGGSIDAINNFSEGVWRNGTNPGQYLYLENDFADFTVTGVYFHNGASVNVKRDEATTSGVITFEDAAGLLAGANYEDDDASAETGAVRWTYTHELYQWTGAVDRDWNNALNWNIPGGGHAVPNENVIAVIPDVSDASGNNPIIGIGAGSANGACYDLMIELGGHLTFSNDKDLVVENTVTVVSGGTININPGSLSTITVGDIWSVDGTFNNGGSSTVLFNGSAGKLLTIAGHTPFYNLTIQSSGSAEYLTGAALDIDGDFNIISGTFTVSDEMHNMNIAGNFSNSGTFNHGNGTVVFNGENQTISSPGTGSFYNISCAGTETKFVGSDFTVANDVQIQNNVTFNGGTYNLFVKGNWVNKGTFEPNTGTVVFNGTKTQMIDNYQTENFYNFTLNNTAATFPQLVLYGNVNINGTDWTMTDGVIETTEDQLLTIGSNVTLTGGNSNVSYVSGPLAKVGSADFVFPIGDGTKFARLGISGLTGSGTFKARYFEEAYDDVANVETALSHVSGYEHWTLDRTSGGGEPFVSFYWEDGAVSGIDNLVTLSTAVYAGGQWVNRGNGGTTGTVAAGSILSDTRFDVFGPCGFASTNEDNPLNGYNRWTGQASNDWHNLNNWSMGLVPTATTDALIPAAPLNQPVIDSDAEVRKLTIDPGAKLIVNPLKSLTTEGNFFINGDLILESNVSGNASLINKQGISYGTACNVVQKLYISGGQYHYVSSPMATTHADRFKVDPVAPYYNPNFYSYDETDTNEDWTATAWHQHNGNMEVMTGYSVYYDLPRTIIFDRAVSGNFNTGDRSKTLTYTGNSMDELLHRGWNLVGNPFPANLDWDGPGWTKTNIYNSLYFWNGSNYSYHVSSGPGFFNTGDDVNNASSIIPPAQGFFVKVKEGGDNTQNQTGVLGIPASARTTAEQAFWKKEQAKLKTDIDAIRLTVSRDGKTDETLIRFIPGASSEFDADYDAFKLFPSDWYEMPQIYSVLPNNIASINTLSGYYDELVVPLGLQSPTGGLFSINIPEFDLTDDTDIYFEDVYEGKVMNINNGLFYSFNSDAGKFNDRFRILFSVKQTTEVDANDSPDVQIYAHGYNYYIKSAEEKAVLGMVNLYNMYGALVKSVNNTQAGFASFSAIDLPAGFYIVKLKNKYGTYTGKVFLSGKM